MQKVQTVKRKNCHSYYNKMYMEIKPYTKNEHRN